MIQGKKVAEWSQQEFLHFYLLLTVSGRQETS